MAEEVKPKSANMNEDDGEIVKQNNDKSLMKKKQKGCKEQYSFADISWSGLPVTYLPCPHMHFRAQAVDRCKLSPDEHLNLLATPKGYIWEKDPYCRRRKRRRCRRNSFGRCEKRYINEFLAEIWCTLTPEIMDHLKNMLVDEFGMSHQEAEDFINEQKETGMAKRRKRICKKVNLGIRHCWIREFTKMMADKLTEYVVFMLCVKRTRQQRLIAETILRHLCDITGEECTLSTPKTRIQRIMVFMADRLALWLAAICECTKKKGEGDGDGDSGGKKDKPFKPVEGGEKGPGGKGGLEETQIKTDGKDKQQEKQDTAKGTSGKDTPKEEAGTKEGSLKSKAASKPMSKVDTPKTKSDKDGQDKTASKPATKQASKTQIATSKTPASKGKSKEPSRKPSTTAVTEPKTAIKSAPETRPKTPPKDDTKSKEDIAPKGDTKDGVKKKDLIDHVGKWIDETELNKNPRQEALADTLGKKLADLDEAASVAEFTEKLSAWIDKTITQVELEAGLGKGKKGAVFHIKKGKKNCYDVKKIAPEICKEKVAQGRAAMRSKNLNKKPDNLNAVTPTEAKLWAEWAVDVADVAEQWADWIDRTVCNAEKKAARKKGKIPGPRLTKEEWKKFQDITQQEAIDWRRSKRMIKETAKMWDQKAEKTPQKEVKPNKK